jgi:LuxR family transcriptional regulator, positive regulator of biofilm formation
MPNRDSKHSPDGSLSENEFIFIVGPNKLQNELLMNFLTERIESNCNCIPKIVLDEINQSDASSKYLFMLDCQQEDLSLLWETLNNRNESIQSNCLFALYNVDQKIAIEKEALDRGINGVFYSDDDLSNLARGARAILDGELWFHRKLLSQSLIHRERKNRFSSEKLNCLTQREREILTRLVTGAGNKKIADDLFISPHTVKTHIYNIYKKLEINNRLQATLWAAKHL